MASQTQAQRAKNEAYWASRLAAEQKWQRENLANDAAFNAKMQATYDKALSSIQKDIDSALAKYAQYSNQSIAAARRQVAANDVRSYEADAKDIVARAHELYDREGAVSFDDFTNDVNERLRLYNATMRINQLELVKSQIGQEMLAANMKVNAELISKLSGDYQAELRRQAGILGESVTIANKGTLARILMQREGDYTFSDRLWLNHDILKAQLDTLLVRAMIQGRGPRDIAQHLKDQVADAVTARRYVTERLARTESARVQTLAQLDSFKRYGYAECRWVAEPSACPICLEIAEGGRDGRGIYKVDEVPSIPVHPNCRCSVSAWEEDVVSPAVMPEAEQSGVDEMNRRSTEPINNPITKKELMDAFQGLKAKGWTIEQGPAVEEHLANRRASAAIIPAAKSLLFSENPNRAEVYEEIFHANQIESNGGPFETLLLTINAEIEAQHYLLSNAKRLKLIQAEVDETLKNLSRWEKDRERNEGH